MICMGVGKSSVIWLCNSRRNSSRNRFGLCLAAVNCHAQVKGSVPVLLLHPLPLIIPTQTSVVQPKTPKGDSDEEERKAFQNRFAPHWCF